MGCQGCASTKNETKQRKEENQATTESVNKEVEKKGEKIKMISEDLFKDKVESEENLEPLKEKLESDLVWLKVDKPIACSNCNKKSTQFSPFSKNNEFICKECSGPLPDNPNKADYLKANTGNNKIFENKKTTKPNIRLQTSIVNSNKERNLTPNPRKPNTAKQTALKGNDLKRCDPGNHVLQVQRTLHKKECEVCKEAKGLICRRCQYLICQKCNKSLLTGDKPMKNPQSVDKQNPTTPIKESEVEVQKEVEPKTQLQEMSDLLKDLQKKNENIQIALSVVIDRNNMINKPKVM